jgi:hypothetical protein
MSTQPGARTGYGWPVLTSTTTGPLPRLRKWWIPDTDRHIFLRDGSAGFVLVHLILWFHERIEDIDDGIWDEWGYAYRMVRGSTSSWSEHAAGTAADLNATRHPLGVPTTKTFSAWQILRIRWRLRRVYRGVIMWGGDYKNRPDAMHFEIAPGKTLADCERLARRLMRTKRGQRILEDNTGARAVILS